MATDIYIKFYSDIIKNGGIENVSTKKHNLHAQLVGFNVKKKIKLNSPGDPVDYDPIWLGTVEENETIHIYVWIKQKGENLLESNKELIIINYNKYTNPYPAHVEIRDYNRMLPTRIIIGSGSPK